MNRAPTDSSFDTHLFHWSEPEQLLYRRRHGQGISGIQVEFLQHDPSYILYKLLYVRIEKSPHEAVIIRSIFSRFLCNLDQQKKIRFFSVIFMEGFNQGKVVFRKRSIHCIGNQHGSLCCFTSIHALSFLPATISLDW